MDTQKEDVVKVKLWLAMSRVSNLVIYRLQTTASLMTNHAPLPTSQKYNVHYYHLGHE